MQLETDHKMLTVLIEELHAKTRKKNEDLPQEFVTRLAVNFGRLRALYWTLYGHSKSVNRDFSQLIQLLYESYLKRDNDLKYLDRQRESQPDWLLHQKWVGMSLYAEHFNGDLKGFQEKLPYLQELGINLVHLMPVLMSPENENDGGYAVSDYRKVRPELGKMSDIHSITEKFRKEGMLLVMDVVINHTSNQHKWAKKARKGKKKYQRYYFMYDDRSLPDQYETSLPQIFPESAPGNFTYLKDINKWVMTVFRNYQWDLNYKNPQVFIEMQKVLIFLANQGVDILRLDAPAFIWKEMGTSCQNLPQAHTLLQLMKRSMQIVAPGVKFIAEAIVRPQEIVKYFAKGTNDPECDIAYHATLMALLWNSLATSKVDLLYRALHQMPEKPLGTTWINYIRGHDDIGLGFDDEHIYQAGYDARMHRKFLYDYYTGRYQGSPAKGALFMYNPANGDARISGTLASLAGLETALKSKDSLLIERATQKILLTHAVIMTFGGLPMIFSGDEIGLLNDYSFINNDAKREDNRWLHRPMMNWETAKNRTQTGTVTHTLFRGLQKLIRIRKALPELVDFNNLSLVNSGNQHVFIFKRYHNRQKLLVLVNFQSSVQLINKFVISSQGLKNWDKIIDLYTGKPVKCKKNFIKLSGYQFSFLQEIHTKRKPAS
jgi:amylosucrase